jgi:pimeloyl-ACP methyl ester carboxylesterase
MLTIKHPSVSQSAAAAGPVRPVVALHSSASTGGQWKSLAAALDGREVFTPDLPGYGRASFRDGTHDEPASLAGDAAAVLRWTPGRRPSISSAIPTAARWP